jgi:hypothetical protein
VEGVQKHVMGGWKVTDAGERRQKIISVSLSDPKATIDTLPSYCNYPMLEALGNT